MSKKTYQITGNITANVVANVNQVNSNNTKMPKESDGAGTAPPKGPTAEENPGKSNNDSSQTKKRKSPCCICCILSFISLAFAIILCIVHFPRIIQNNNLGFDYLGLIVGILAFLAALLVGWQIYNTINAKQEFDTLEKKFSHDYDDRIKRLEDCCKDSKEEIRNINSEIERIDKYPFLREMYNEAVQYLSNNNYVSAIKNFAYVGKFPYDYFFIRNAVTKIVEILSRYGKNFEKKDVEFELSSLVKILDEREGVVDHKDLTFIKRYLENKDSRTQA